MKFSLIIYIFFFIFSVIAKNGTPDYLSSGYYQNVYKAHLYELQGNNKKAYQELKKAERACSLLNMSEYYEMEQMLRLSLKYKDYKKADQYLDLLVSCYGYLWQDFKNLENFSELYSSPNWQEKQKKLENSSRNFVSDTALVLTLDLMRIEDSTCRSHFPLNKEVLIKHKNEHYVLLQKIIAEQGFPLDRLKRLAPLHRNMVSSALNVIFLHMPDSVKTFEMEPILYKYIKSGDCPPQFLGDLMDRYCLEHGFPFLYGVYENAGPSEIKNLKRLDKRRISIGLPSKKIENEIGAIKMEILKAFYEKGGMVFPW